MSLVTSNVISGFGALTLIVTSKELFDQAWDYFFEAEPQTEEEKEKRDDLFKTTLLKNVGSLAATFGVNVYTLLPLYNLMLYNFLKGKSPLDPILKSKPGETMKDMKNTIETTQSALGIVLMISGVVVGVVFVYSVVK